MSDLISARYLHSMDTKPKKPEPITKEEAIEEVRLRLVKESGEVLDSYAFHVRNAFEYQQRLEKLLCDIIILMPNKKG